MWLSLRFLWMSRQGMFNMKMISLTLRPYRWRRTCWTMLFRSNDKLIWVLRSWRSWNLRKSANWWNISGFLWGRRKNIWRSSSQTRQGSHRWISFWYWIYVRTIKLLVFWRSMGHWCVVFLQKPTSCTISGQRLWLKQRIIRVYWTFSRTPTRSTYFCTLNSSKTSPFTTN